MADKKSHTARVLKYWRSIETFTLPDMPDPKFFRQKYFTGLRRGDELPWQSADFLSAPPGKEWRHTLYFYPVTKEAVIRLLEELVPQSQNEFREAQPGNTFHAALVLDQAGLAAERTYRRSYFPYGIKILRERRNPEELNDLLKKAYTDYHTRFGVKERTGPSQTDPAVTQPDSGSQEDAEGRGSGKGGKLCIAEGEPEQSEERREQREEERPGYPQSWVELEKELDDLDRLTNHRLTSLIPVLCVTEEVTARTGPEPPFLNSFYLNDLTALIGQTKDLGAPMETYLAVHADTDSRKDLLSPETLFACLDPQRQSPGRWPAPPAFGLYSAQQAALHLAISTDRQRTRLMGINGPPGTGKTTLLREIVSDIVVGRARRLLKTDVTKLFSTRQNEIAEYARYYMFDKKVFGNDGILVSSNNNSAVENISKELPALKSIDAEIFGDADYFSSVAQNLQTEAPCWGLISAVLGNSTNRNLFSKNFWFDRKNGFDVYLKGETDAEKNSGHIKKFGQLSGELNLLLKEFEGFQSIASEHYSILSGWITQDKIGKAGMERLAGLVSRLINEYQVRPCDLPDRDFLTLAAGDLHRLTPYSSPKMNELRSRIFLKSLRLHECAILANAKYFRSNLSAFVDLLSGKHADHMNEKIRTTLWGSLFFCIPVVSATLASIERLFTGMGKGSIGWLLLDEAGQASPQSACGAIWRSERSILSGDTLQIPPVVTIPEGLSELLRSQYGLEEPCWSPLRHSAQFLADRVTQVGTLIDRGGSEIWTGIPLRAHRRCQEPMFSIANTIAYNGQMVKLTPDAEKDGRFPESCWIDVRGMLTLKGHVIAEEINALQEMLALLQSRGYQEEIFIISPFRSIGDYCREQFAPRKDLRARSGTIHTFQGKEADIVMLVLGTDWEHPGARKWASSAPNILNVAVTRARKKLYVIGNRPLWASCNYFDHLAQMLPAKGYKQGELLQYF
ncbi:MAG TPA: AAA domain-containing protein [Puia sp.]|nr:AAA domain-containing protein [Puia sp.]